MEIFFTTAFRAALGPIQPPIRWVPGALSLGLKRLGPEADHHHHLVPSSKNEWRYTSTPSISPHGVVLSLKKKARRQLYLYVLVLSAPYKCAALPDGRAERQIFTDIWNGRIKKAVVHWFILLPFPFNNTLSTASWTSGGLFWTWSWTIGFHKRRRISWVAQPLSASQKWLFYTKLVGYLVLNYFTYIAFNQ